MQNRNSFNPINLFLLKHNLRDKDLAEKLGLSQDTFGRQKAVFHENLLKAIKDTFNVDLRDDVIKHLRWKNKELKRELSQVKNLIQKQESDEGYSFFGNSNVAGSKVNDENDI